MSKTVVIRRQGAVSTSQRGVLVSPQPICPGRFPGSAYAGVAKIGLWAGSALAAPFGVLTLLLSPAAVAGARRTDCQLPTPAKAADNERRRG